MKHVKHLFGFWLSTFSIEEPYYLLEYHQCKYCLNTAEDLFKLFDRKCTDFLRKSEQEIWLNTYTPCLTVEEKSIKDLLE